MEIGDVANQCPRCGHVAAADGHATYGETLDCLEAFALAQQLARWTKQWTEESALAFAPRDGTES